MWVQFCVGFVNDVAPLALCAGVFEHHFTLDRIWNGDRHATSLEPAGMRKLARRLCNIG